jgi:glycosyltransferase involved in cell wall biosynthesis
LKLSIIIPTYNEEKTIVPLIEKLLKVNFVCETEIVIVNDGSTDSTPLQIQALLKKHANLVGVDSLKNAGKGAAIKRGLAQVTGDYLIVQDADLELDPTDITKLWDAALKKNAQVVYGSRFRKPERCANFPAATRLANWVLTKYTNMLFGSKLTDMATCYKLIKTEIIKNITLCCNGFDFEPEITAKLLNLGHRIIEVPINYFPRSRREGKKINWLDALQYFFILTKYKVNFSMVNHRHS